MYYFPFEEKDIPFFLSGTLINTMNNFKFTFSFPFGEWESINNGK